jgi:hypothetical protein
MRPHLSARLSALGCLFVVTISGVLGLAQSAESTDKSTAPVSDVHPVLIELFTSEGCSSCPPADILLQKLDAIQPTHGAQLIVLSEHVTYWDHDGWKDPNSSEALTDRQSSYENALHLPTPYTPQMIVDGTQEIQIDKPQQVEEVLEKARLAAKVPMRISGVAVDAGSPALLKARIEADANFEKKNADIYVALALDHVESQVLRGENGGRHLVHVAVVRKLTKVGKIARGKPFSTDLQIKLSPDEETKNLRLIAFAQEPGPGVILGAAEWKASLESSSGRGSSAPSPH